MAPFALVAEVNLSRRVFILGAGASYDHSQGAVPTTAGFLVKAFERNLDHLIPGQDDHFIQVSQRISALYGIDPRNSDDHRKLRTVNIEELATLEVLEASIQGTTSSIEIERFIADRVRAFESEVPNDFAPRTYNRFAVALTPEDSVISFNWDTMLDRRLPGYASADATTPPGDLYLEYLKICTSELDGTWEGLEMPRPYRVPSRLERQTFNPPAAFIKLHGSADLAACRNQSCRNFQKPLRTLPPTALLRCGACYEPLFEYVVPPVLAKPIQTMPAIRRAWRRAYEHVQSCEELVIWGYSLPPTDFWAHWLLRAIAGGPCRKVTIINPEVQYKSGSINKTFVRRFLPQLCRDRPGFVASVCTSYAAFENASGRPVVLK